MLKANATVILQPDYEYTDLGLKVHFVSPDPGAGESSDYYIWFTYAEVQGFATAAAFVTALTARLALTLRGGPVGGFIAANAGRVIVVP